MLPVRKTPHHGGSFGWNLPEIQYLTVCTQGRAPILATEEAHLLVNEAWRAADSWLVGRYVIMPDHIHLFCAPALEHSLLDWLKYWKSFVTKHRPECWSKPVFQRDGWDTRMRNSEQYLAKWEYVRYNLVRKGFVTEPEQWRYAGEIHDLSL